MPPRHAARSSASPRPASRAALALLAAFTLAPRSARATLGGTVASVRVDAQRLGGAHTVTASPAWELHAIRVGASGPVVHEYLTPGGTVFAVAWAGRGAPDLRQLLGASFADYVAMARARHAGRHRIALSGPRLAIEATVHNRAFSGRAWVPGALPAGFAFGRVR